MSSTSRRKSLAWIRSPLWPPEGHLRHHWCTPPENSTLEGTRTWVDFLLGIWFCFTYIIAINPSNGISFLTMPNGQNQYTVPANHKVTREQEQVESLVSTVFMAIHLQYSSRHQNAHVLDYICGCHIYINLYIGTSICLFSYACKDSSAVHLHIEIHFIINYFPVYFLHMIVRTLC